MPTLAPALAPPAVRTWARTVQRKRHALLGTACALGLIIAPLTASVVVIGVTANGPSSDAPALNMTQPSTGADLASSSQSVNAALPPATASAPPAVAAPPPDNDGRRQRGLR